MLCSRYKIAIYVINKFSLLCILFVYTYVSVDSYLIVFHVGRVLNRFSKDIGFIDAILPYQSVDFLTVSSTGVKG